MDRNNRKRTILLGVLGLTVLSSFAYRAEASSSSKSTLGSSDDHVILQLSYYHMFNYAGFYAALKKGFYREEGLDVTIQEGGKGFTPTDKVLAGEAHYGVEEADILLLRMQGKPIVVLATHFQRSPWALMVRADSGIVTPSDLVGKKIMMELNPRDAPILAMLKNEGVPLEKLKIVQNSWDVQDVIDGVADAKSIYVNDSPHQMERQGVAYRLIHPVNYGIDFYGDCTFTSEDELANHPDRVAAFRRASLKGWRYALENPEELIEFILALPGVRDRGLTHDFLRFEAQETAKLMESDLIEIGHMNPGRWQRMADIYTSLQMAEPGISLEGFMYNPVPEPDYTWVRWLVGIVTVTLLFTIMVTVWNVQLHRRVQKHTQALRHSEANYRRIVETAHEGIWVTDADVKTIFVNERMARMLCVTADQLLGRPMLEFVANTDRETYHSIFRPHGEAIDRQTEIIELRFIRHDGSLLWARLHTSPFGRESVQPAGTLTMVSDITESKNTENELREYRNHLEVLVQDRTAELRDANKLLQHEITERALTERENKKLASDLHHAQKMKAIGTLASGITHEFSNILTAIFGYTSLARKTLKKSHPAIQSLEGVETAAKQASDMTDALLAFAHKSEIDKRPIELVDTVLSAIQLLRHILRTSIELVEDVPRGESIWIMAAKSPIQQVIINLAINAQEAIPHSGQLRLCLKKRREKQSDDEGAYEDERVSYAVLIVEDSGLGMSSETKDRLFEPFFTTKEGVEGTGLGLSIVHGIVKAFDGQIEVESEQGRGSRFIITFPCCEPSFSAAGQPSRDVEPRHGVGQILLVEDDPQIRSMMASMLHSRGYNVIQAADGEQAVTVFEKHQFELKLVLLDLDIPKKNGVSCLEEISKIQIKVPVVVVTVDADLESQVRGLLPDCRILRKPFQLSELTEIIDKRLLKSQEQDRHDV